MKADCAIGLVVNNVPGLGGAANEIDVWGCIVDTVPSLGCGCSGAALPLEQSPSFDNGGGPHGAIFVADIRHFCAGDIAAQIPM